MRRRRLLLLFYFLQLQWITREFWVHPLNDCRVTKGEFYVLYPDLRHFPPRFFRMYRMGVQKFELLDHLAARLRKKAVNFCGMILPEQEQVLTLRWVHSVLYKLIKIQNHCIKFKTLIIKKYFQYKLEWFYYHLKSYFQKM